MTQKLEEPLMMDRATKRLHDLHVVIAWLLQHANDMPNDLYQKKGRDYIPFDIKMHLVELVRCDFANIITPTALWQEIAKSEGVEIKSEGE